MISSVDLVTEYFMLKIRYLWTVVQFKFEYVFEIFYHVLNAAHVMN